MPEKKSHMLTIGVPAGLVTAVVGVVALKYFSSLDTRPHNPISDIQCCQGLLIADAKHEGRLDELEEDYMEVAADIDSIEATQSQILTNQEVERVRRENKTKDIEEKLDILIERE